MENFALVYKKSVCMCIAYCRNRRQSMYITTHIEHIIVPLLLVQLGTYNRKSPYNRLLPLMMITEKFKA